jgi:hypothetical protein
MFVIGPLSALGLGLAMATDAPQEEPYPAKIIVAWEKDHTVIERPFVSQLTRYRNLTGVQIKKQISITPDRNRIIYRTPQDCVIIILGGPLRFNLIKTKLLSWSQVSASLPYSDNFQSESVPRIIWFLAHLMGKPGPWVLSTAEHLRMGIPFPITPEMVEIEREHAQFELSDIREDPLSPPHPPGHSINVFASDVRRILHGEPCYLTSADFSAYLEVLDQSISVDIQYPQSTYSFDDLVAEGKLYLSINLYNANFKLKRIKIERNKSAIDHLLETGILERTLSPIVRGQSVSPHGSRPNSVGLSLELAEDYDTRIKGLIREGTPDYMDGYESMATLIDRKQGISWLSEEEFEEMFRTSP